MNRTRDRDVDNVRVVVRCRGRNKREISENAKIIVDASNETQVRITARPTAPAKIYTVDQVFGAEADQRRLYTSAVSPLVDDFITGINCTVFAYGQTGTGKTYTITGDCSDVDGVHAGVIPRVLNDVFRHLETSPKDFCLSCQYVELYNEELRDLLDESDSPRPLRLLDDPARRTVKIRGLEEVLINSTESALKLLARANSRRKSAATKLNAASSRSHAIFTLKLAIMGKNQDTICSKLHLVDLAGSENIARSGAEKSRAREAGSINQSLLVLGRVISSLVDRSARVPYRDSKLTRILQDSLGGSTKTCLIATLSPVSEDGEESLSTLEYASRAKSIKNHPQIAPAVSKPLMLRELALANEALRSELAAQRDHDNGVYLASSEYERVTAERESRENEILEARGRLDAQESEISRLTALLKEVTQENQSTGIALADASLRIENLEVQNSALSTHVGELGAERDHLRRQVELLESRLDHREQSAASQQEQASKVREKIVMALDDLQASIQVLETSMRDRQSHLSQELGNVLAHCRKGLDALDPPEIPKFALGSEFKHSCRVEVARGIEAIEHAIAAEIQLSHSETEQLFTAAREPLHEAIGYTKELKRTLENDALAARALSQLTTESQEFFQSYNDQLAALQQQRNELCKQSTESEQQLVELVRTLFAKQRQDMGVVIPAPNPAGLKSQIAAINDAIGSAPEVSGTLQLLDESLANSRLHLQNPPKHAAELTDVGGLVKTMSASIEEAIDALEQSASGSVSAVQSQFLQRLVKAQEQFESAGTRVTSLAESTDQSTATNGDLQKSVQDVQHMIHELPSCDVELPSGEIGRGVTVRMHPVGRPAQPLQELDLVQTPNRKRRTATQRSPDNRKRAAAHIY